MCRRGAVGGACVKLTFEFALDLEGGLLSAH